MESNHRTGPPPAQGLYHPAQEHDACGVGFVVNIRGEASHQIVRSGIEILVNLTHRGACGCDPLTGDGAGILTQIPHEFFAEKARELGMALPPRGDYAVGAMFLPTDEAERQFAVEQFERIVAAEGQVFLGWRDMPVDNSVLGYTAREVEPVIRQIFVGRGRNTPADMFDWKLYVIRKCHENAIDGSHLTQKRYCYIPSLS
ncbi:MAG TPA: glutamate synthase subunit alpha, partial [Pirellulales bacterium]|nr:glutamate synthase subunit alpha [Pirellulales bacterium]